VGLDFSTKFLKVYILEKAEGTIISVYRIIYLERQISCSML
jgi:hypothetical protein